MNAYKSNCSTATRKVEEKEEPVPSNLSPNLGLTPPVQLLANPRPPTPLHAQRNYPHWNWPRPGCVRLRVRVRVTVRVKVRVRHRAKVGAYVQGSCRLCIHHYHPYHPRLLMSSYVMVDFGLSGNWKAATTRMSAVTDESNTEVIPAQCT